MVRSRGRIIEVTAKDDAKWDKCFFDLSSLGLKTNCKFTAYASPKDAAGKAVYNFHFNRAKEKQ